LHSRYTAAEAAATALLLHMQGQLQHASEGQQWLYCAAVAAAVTVIVELLALAAATSPAAAAMQELDRHSSTVL
jgi:hypothetical protein